MCISYINTLYIITYSCSYNVIYLLYNRGIESLVVVPISQVSSDQRAGRAGMHIDTYYAHIIYYHLLFLTHVYIPVCASCTLYYYIHTLLYIQQAGQPPAPVIASTRPTATAT